MKTYIKIIPFSCFLFLLACSPQPVRKANLIEYEISNSYKIKLPDYVDKKGEGYWQTSDYDSKEFSNIQIQIKGNNITDLQTSITELANKNSNEIFQNKIFIKNEPFEKDGMKGLVSYYKKDNNRGIYPVMSYFIYAIIRDHDSQIEFESYTMKEDCQTDLRASLFSIIKEGQSKVPE